jgi:hypothetical protein
MGRLEFHIHRRAEEDRMIAALRTGGLLLALGGFLMLLGNFVTPGSLSFTQVSTQPKNYDELFVQSQFVRL